MGMDIRLMGGSMGIDFVMGWLVVDVEEGRTAAKGFDFRLINSPF